MADVATGSREYKIMLQAKQFAGDEPQVLQKSAEFWRTACKAFGPAVLMLRGSLDQPKDRRLIRFLDTADQHLGRNAYIFRERVALDGQKRECTLKFRHPDRFLAASRDMKPINGKSRVKFEEDIKPRFQSLYSFSATQEISTDKKLDKFKDVLKLYPGLRDSLSGFNVDEPLTAVSNFTAREIVVGGASMQIGKRLDVWASCVMVVWYDHAKENGLPDGTPPTGTPVLAEFSFKYGGDGQRFGPGTVSRAYEVFQALQDKLPDWFDRQSTTKTAFIYA